MTTTLNFKAGLDRVPWRPEALAPSAIGNAGGFAFDMRNNNTRIPLVFIPQSATAFYQYNPITGEWLPLSSPALSGIAAGAATVFHPSQGPRGTISAASSTSSFTLSSLSTAGGAAVGTNQLANRGDGTGFTIRVVDNASGASGKTEEVVIIANTSGATPVVKVFPALTFTPTANSTYEILSGRVFLLGSGALASGSWRYYDVACNSFTTKTQTNLAATIATDSFLLAMSELYVSSDRSPGDGYLNDASTYNNGASKAILASGTAATTITATTLTAPSTPSLATNEYRNFQVRIVEDTTAPTAVGQRRNITSHTSGATPVFTVATWTVTPTAGVAKFVIELNDDYILARTSASTNMYNYKISTDAWDASTTWAAGGSANGAGNLMAPAWGLVRDVTNNRLQGDIFVFRGASTNTLDLFQPTAGSTGAWTAGITYGNLSSNWAPTTGFSGCSDLVSNGGKYFHIKQNTSAAASRLYRFNVMTQTLENGTYMPYPGGSSAVGQYMFMGYSFDGTTKIPMIYMVPCNLTQMFSQVVPY